jgi:putative endonuclease
VWLGREGERLAARHLKRSGYRVLYRNFRAPHGGEVDLVCRNRDTLVFVEVKTRRSLTFGSPAESVTREKQKLIARGALAWLDLLGNPDDILFRFDIVEIVFEDGVPTFHIIKDAFKLPEPYVY